MARPRQAQLRDQKVTFRVSAEELVSLRERAAKSRQTITDFGRAQMLTKRRGRKPKVAINAPLTIIDPDVFHELRRIGVNLNQIARHCNRHQVPPPAGFDTLVRHLIGVLNHATPDAPSP